MSGTKFVQWKPAKWEPLPALSHTFAQNSIQTRVGVQETTSTAIADPRQVGRQAYVSIRSLKPRDFVSLPRGSGESRCITSNERSEHSLRPLPYWCKGLDNFESLGGALKLEEKSSFLFAKSSRGRTALTGRYRKNVSAMVTPPLDLIMLTI